MKKTSWLLSASLSVLLTSGALAEDSKPPIAFPSPTQGATTAYQLPANTDGYQALVAPDLESSTFNPDPAMSSADDERLGKLDVYCDVQVNKISGRLHQLMKTSSKYGVIQGLTTMLGAVFGFGAHINPWSYLAYAGFSALGGGAANADEVWQEMLLSSKGYCMAVSVYKQDELHGTLSHISIVPIFVGSGQKPPVDPTLKDTVETGDTQGRKKALPPPGMIP